jgi:hypothetical protein
MRIRGSRLVAMTESTAPGTSGPQDDDQLDQQNEELVDDELEAHDIPALPEAEPAEGPAPAA